MQRYPQSILTSWNPFQMDRRMASLRDLLDSAFQLAGGHENGSRGDRNWSPVLDIHDEGEQLVIRVEVAGMKKEDFDLSLEGDVLQISGERKYEDQDRKGESFRSERFFGQFSRSVTLPVPVQVEKIRADYKDGILTVTLPKAEEAKPKKIEVKVS